MYNNTGILWYLKSSVGRASPLLPRRGLGARQTQGSPESSRVVVCSFLQHASVLDSVSIWLTEGKTTDLP